MGERKIIHVYYSDPEGWLDDEEDRIPPDDDVFLPYDEIDDEEDRIPPDDPPDDDVFLPYDEIDDDGFADWPDLDSFEN